MIKFSVFLLTLVAINNAGKLVPPPNQRITGGHLIDIKDHPYQICLEKWGYPSCGGVIINEKWALTSAKCVQYVEPYDITLHVGSSHSRYGGFYLKVKHIVLHPNYVDGLYHPDWDYGLMKLESFVTFPFNETAVKTIKLAESEPTPGTVGFVSGWGALEIWWNFPELLYGVDVHMISRKDCDAAYGNHGNITDRMICAQDPDKTFCRYDEGDPLINKETGELIGLASWGLEEMNCQSEGYPGVYSSIVAVKPWIDEISSDLSDN